jgi:hypothetical protein
MFGINCCVVLPAMSGLYGMKKPGQLFSDPGLCLPVYGVFFLVMPRS